MSAVITHKSACRICRDRDLTRVLAFGSTPLANSFLPPNALHEPEQYFPLDAYLCKKCGLLQLLDVVSPEVLFKDYVYVSSTSPVFVAHFEKLANEVSARFKLGNESLVIDIGSNDGILLRPFKKRGVRVLGIEPDKAIARIAQKSGIETVPHFFRAAIAKKLRKKYGQADVITATNVFAHIDDIHDVARGVKLLLKKDGVFIIEVPYLVDFLRKNLFDTVYHEHLSYFSVSALHYFFERVGMHIVDVERVTTHGGSLRVFAQKRRVTQMGTQINADEKISGAVEEFLRHEKEIGLRKEKVYKDYALRIEKNRAKLLALLAGLREKGKRTAGYGAPAKGNTLLNYFSIGSDLVEYIVDDSPHKQGKYTPGKRIPVVSSERLRIDPPDYLLILAWNFAPSIIARNEVFRKKGGMFIIPVPTPRVIK